MLAVLPMRPPQVAKRATAAPVYVADPDCAGGRIARFLQALRDRDRILPFADGLEAFAVTPLRETARIASQVRTRLPL